MSKTKKKIAVLGGGISSLTAVYQLSQSDEYEIDVYQIGWRLGGKGASGRNREKGDRIEEHGLHVWMGFYDNSFSIMREVYKELDRAKDAPLSQLLGGNESKVDYSNPMGAFTPMNQLRLLGKDPQGKHLPWDIDFPTNSLEPGVAGPIMTTWGYIETTIKWVIDGYKGHPSQAVESISIFHADGSGRLAERFKKLLAPTKRIIDLLTQHNITAIENHNASEHAAFHLIMQLFEKLQNIDKALFKHIEDDFAELLYWALERYFNHRWDRIKDTVKTDTDERRNWIMDYFRMSYVAGLLKDKVYSRGFEWLNAYDVRDWFEGIQMVADPYANQLAFDSAYMQTFYDLAFHYKDGNPNDPRMAAGVTLKGFARMILGYKGSILYFMNAGMGDAIFAPIYQLLKRRGVRFHFFNKVTNIGLSADKKAVETINISRQVNLNGGEYQPLILVKDLPCWPSKPLYEQIVEGEELRQANVNLEHANNHWTDTGGNFTLDATKGDFDHVILGITLAALPPITKELTAVSEPWQAMLTNIGTVQTQAMQLWFNKSEEELIDVEPTPPPHVTGAYVEPFSSLTNFTHLLNRENWPADGPKYLAYDCGVLPEKTGETQQEANERVHKNIADFLSNHAQPLWPKATDPCNSHGLDWNVLYASKEAQGEARLAEQYLRANIDPTERYVLTLPGTVKYRIKADGTGFDRLIITGTWTDSGVNLACIEAGVVSGMMAARVLTGVPTYIPGEA